MKKVLFFCIALIVFLSSFFLLFIDNRLCTVLNSYIDSEVEKVSYYIVGRIAERIKYSNPSDYLIISRNSNGIIERVSYNTEEITRLKNEIQEIAYNECLKFESGIVNESYFVQQSSGRNRYRDIKYGYLCEVSISSIRNSTLFGNIGPTIPIKLSFMNYNDVMIDIDIKEYGINNVMVQVNLIISLNCIVTMPISSRTHNTVIKQPISVELISGNVPSYYSSN